MSTKAQVKCLKKSRVWRWSGDLLKRGDCEWERKHVVGLQARGASRAWRKHWNRGTQLATTTNHGTRILVTTLKS